MKRTPRSGVSVHANEFVSSQMEFGTKGRVSQRRPVQFERFYRIVRASVCRYFSRDLADETGKFETVRRTLSHDDLRVIRQMVDHEIPIGWHRVETTLRVKHRPE